MTTEFEIIQDHLRQGSFTDCFEQRNTRCLSGLQPNVWMIQGNEGIIAFFKLVQRIHKTENIKSNYTIGKLRIRIKIGWSGIKSGRNQDCSQIISMVGIECTVLKITIRGQIVIRISVVDTSAIWSGISDKQAILKSKIRLIKITGAAARIRSII